MREMSPSNAGAVAPLPRERGAKSNVDVPTSSSTSGHIVDAVRTALQPYGVDIVEPLCLGWINDELAAAVARRARKRGIDPPTSASARGLLLLPSLPPPTLCLLVAHSRAAFESLASSPEAPSGDESGDPLASHVSSAVDAALASISSLLNSDSEQEAATVVWRPSSSVSSSSPPSFSSTAVAVAAALACGWAPGVREIGVPCVSPRFGPWIELAAVIVVSGGGGSGNDAATSTTSILHCAPRPPRTSRRNAAVCPSALAYSRLVSRSSSGGGFRASETADRLSSSPPPRLSPSPSTTIADASPSLSSSASPAPVPSALAPKTPPLPGGRGGGQHEEEEEEQEGIVNDFDAVVVAKMTEARSALSPGHIFSYPPLMLRYLYSPDAKARAGALEEAREAAARARGKVQHF